MDPTARLAAVPMIRSRRSLPNGDDIEVAFRQDEDLSERVVFPITDAQSNGIEDARFVEFYDGGRKTFYATYTAYSGRAIRSELIETTDFRSFRMTPLGGSAARNKGMALFPRKIGGRYAMIARQDNEHLYLTIPTTFTHGKVADPSFSPNILGNLFRSAIAAPPLSWTTVGYC